MQKYAATNQPQNDEHKIKLEELYSRLNSSATGLSSTEVINRRKLYGLNIIEEKKPIPWLIKFSKHFINFFAILLWVGSILSFIAYYYSKDDSHLYIGIALGLVVVLNAIFTYIQEYRSEKIMESFRKMLPTKIECLRNGEKCEILAKDLVPGDIIFLNEGDKVPADGRLITENILKVDNSSLTGESEPELRKLTCTHDNILESRNMVFSGTLVQSGNGTAIIYGTGMNTQIGNIIQLTKTTTTVATPLRKEIKRFVNVISVIAIFLGITFFIISMLIGNTSMESLIFAIGIIVANVPEGLLPTVTLALSIAAKKMASRNALIKNLESIETLGSTTVICTDKTGTLTENKISVNSILINLEEKILANAKLAITNELQQLLKIAVLCNNARLGEENQYYGDPTECALLLFASDYVNVKEMNVTNVRLHESPFDSKTKRMITTNETAGKNIAYLKGAPEAILQKCNTILLHGKIVPLTQQHQNKIAAMQKKFALRGERVLALAYKETTTLRATEEEFTFVALTGMIDPLRQEIPQAIASCKTAGIKVVMITGDYSLTAKAIAKQCGILDNNNANIMTGEELDQTDDEKLKLFLQQDNIILARIAPHHKLRIVKILQALNEVVTVTGDGVNDAPALKNADMGVAMGISGTEVAKEASDMVLLDDNFATIVNAIKEGRTIYNNIKRFIAYILTSNIPEILPFIALVLLNIPLPLTVVLILCIDLGTDLLPALGLGIEKAESNIMEIPPRSRKQYLLQPILLLRSYGIIGMLEAAAGFCSYFYVLFTGGWYWGQHLTIHDPLYMQAVSAFFASIILCQIANVLICRTKKQSVLEKGLFSNKLINLGIISELILLAIIIYLPITRPFFGTAYLSPVELLPAIPFVLFIFISDEIRKWFIRRDNVFVSKYLNW
jgi:sodium/potassium-transporting ATPase subunit alpha